MPKLPDPVHEHTTAHAIVKWYEKQPQEPRPHLGCSEIGKRCNRALWYGFRWASERKFNGRMLRLFNTGHREEARFLEELRGIGAEIYDTDPETGNQHRFEAFAGHLAGSCDGIGRGLPEAPKSWAIIEFKTHNAKSFAELQKKGVAEHKPEHHDQMQMYMGLAELDRALYLAVNKDTDELHSEWIHFSQAVFDMLMARADTIIKAAEPPEGISTDPAWFQCKFCDHHALCHGEARPVKNCRTCVSATPDTVNGGWKCESQSRAITTDEQRLGCRSHLYIPMLKWAEPLDAGEGWIKYRDTDSGLIFANVTEDCDRSEDNMTNDITLCVTSAEWYATVRKMLNDRQLADIKNQFPQARVTASQDCGIADEDIPL